MGALIWIVILIIWLFIQWLEHLAAIKASQDRTIKSSTQLERFREQLLKQERDGIREAERIKLQNQDNPSSQKNKNTQQNNRSNSTGSSGKIADVDLKNQIRDGERFFEAELLIKQAKTAIDRDTEIYNPFDTDLLATAIDCYHKSYLLVNKDSCSQAIESLQLEIERRHQFQSLFRTATKYFHEKQFGQALTTLFSAQALYSPHQLIKTISDCEENAKLEKIYLQALDKAKALSHAGKFSDALKIVELATTKFSRQDGADLQVRLNRVIAAKKQLSAGEINQAAGDLTAAKNDYAAAIYLMPEWKEPKLKLAILAAQTGENELAIDRLAEINYPETKCLEGLLYSRSGEYRQARELWSKLDQNLVKEYWQIISNETIEQCKLIQPQIKELVDRGELDQAKAISLKFVKQFGSDSLIETNLTNCILPGIEAKIWKTEDWQKLAIFSCEKWLNQPSINSLHNWTISLYYATQIDGNIERLTIAWSTAIANIDIDPTLQALPWLGSSPSLSDIRARLWHLLEQQIEAIKDSDLPRYLDLRDLYRQEFWAMKLSQEQPDAKITVGELTILPACYQHYYPQISLGEQPEIWKTLYTNWGAAVAACLAGDPERAELIKNKLTINSSLENFANQFILYKQGCYALRQEDWRSASYQLNDAKPAIDANLSWQAEIDELCINHRQNIYDFDEHVDFSQFWHSLLSSYHSQLYVVEYQALKIRFEWANSLISDEESVIKIQDLHDTYPSHLIAAEIFTEIYQYWVNN
jgi:hypothetical protein